MGLPRRCMHANIHSQGVTSTGWTRTDGPARSILRGSPHDEARRRRLRHTHGTQTSGPRGRAGPGGRAGRRAARARAARKAHAACPPARRRARAPPPRPPRSPPPPPPPPPAGGAQLTLCRIRVRFSRQHSTAERLGHMSTNKQDRDPPPSGALPAARRSWRGARGGRAGAVRRARAASKRARSASMSAPLAAASSPAPAAAAAATAAAAASSAPRRL
jgi:hypothetical protein